MDAQGKLANKLSGLNRRVKLLREDLKLMNDERNERGRQVYVYTIELVDNEIARLKDEARSAIELADIPASAKAGFKQTLRELGIL